MNPCSQVPALEKGEKNPSQLGFFFFNVASNSAIKRLSGVSPYSRSHYPRLKPAPLRQNHAGCMSKIT